MHSTFFVLGLLACPLGMALFGGIAWFAAKTFGDRSPRVTRLAQRGTCMHGHAPAASDERGQVPTSEVATHAWA